MSYSKMTLTVTATGKAPTATSLQSVQNAVARALRTEGVVVSTDAVQVEGRLA